MTIQRTSAWDRMRGRWYKDAARSEIREIAGWMPFLLFLLAFVAIASGLENPGEPYVWANHVVGGAAALLALGLLRGAEWARRIGGWIAVAVAVLGLVGLVRALFVPGAAEPGAWAWYLFVDLAWWGIALQLLARDSAEKWAKARAILEDDEVPVSPR